MAAQRQKKRESVINRAAMKKYILAEAARTRPGWDVTRVSAQALDEIEGFIKTKIRESLHRQPSVGKTFMSFY